MIVPLDIKFDQASLNKFNGVMNAFSQQLGRDLKETVVQSTVSLCEQLMEETPPYVNKKGSNGLDAKRIGQKAIKLNLAKSVTPINLVFGGEVKNKNIRKIIRRKDVKALQDVFDNSSGKMKKWKVLPFDKSMHTLGNRKKRYVATFDTKKWNERLRQLQDRVGYMKAGWGYTIQKLGGKVSGWISKCIPFTKAGMTMTNDEAKPVITFWNGTPTITKFQDRYNNAIKRLTDRMLKSLQIKMAYNARKNGLKK